VSVPGEALDQTQDDSVADQLSPIAARDPVWL
jgi:hypothetical protein